MNIAFEGNPYLGSDNKVFSDGSFKVAKMNVETKVPNLIANWEKELAKMSTIASQVGSPNYGNDLILGRLGIKSLDYYARIKRENAKKLKVNPIVANKSKTVYGIKEAIKLDEPVMNNIVNDSTLTRSDAHKEDVVDTRMSRLERTGEIPIINESSEVTMKRETPSINNDVINTPTRFERHNEATPFDALINDKTSSRVEKEQVEMSRSTERTGGDPNLYTKLIHGNNDISARLMDAKNKLSTAKEEREKARAVNASLEAEVANVRKTIEELKKKQEEKAEQELNNTLNMLQTAKEEILGETRKYDNLQEELAELLRQRDSLLNGNSTSYGDDNYSRSSRM